MRGMEICPEYFGESPYPSETPWGQPTQWLKIANGLFWGKVEGTGWVLAVAYPFCDDLSAHARDLAFLTKYGQEHGIDNTFGFRFFTYRSSCVSLFELSQLEEASSWRNQLHKAALKNAILKFVPSYVQDDDYNFPPVSCEEHMIVETPHAGIDFYPSLPR